MVFIYFSVLWKALLFHYSFLTMMFKKEIVAYVYCTFVSVHLSNLFWVAVGWLLNAPGFDLSLSSRLPILENICGVEEIKQEKTCLLQRVRLADSPRGAQLHCRCSHRASSGADTSLAVLRSLEQRLLSYLQKRTFHVSVVLYPVSKVCLVL